MVSGPPVAAEGENAPGSFTDLEFTIKFPLRERRPEQIMDSWNLIGMTERRLRHVRMTSRVKIFVR
jgi:hypothetical protein